MVRTENIELSDVIDRMTILYHSDAFLVVDKPHDIRMDGPHEVTVEKCIKSKLDMLKGPDPYRYFGWVHQLDYATSGVLCIALNKPAARAASDSFQMRKVEKQYLALVYGHIDTSILNIQKKRWKTCNVNEVEIIQDTEHRRFDKLSSLYKHSNEETAIKKIKIQKNKINVDDSMKQKLLEKTLQLFREFISSDNFLDIEEADRIKALELKSIPIEKYLKFAKLRKQLRKFVRRLLPQANDPLMLEDISLENLQDDEEQSISLQQISHDTYGKEVDLTWESGEGIYYISDAEIDEFLITIPLGEIQEQFQCIFGGSPLNLGLYAETKLRILNRGYYQNQPVTKVLLLPKTGRRHQLRMHCLAIGHPIVGDCCYASESFNPSSADRMMLHAFSLKIPIQGWRGTLDGTIRNGENVVDSFIVDVTSRRDPFELS